MKGTQSLTQTKLQNGLMLGKLMCSPEDFVSQGQGVRLLFTFVTPARRQHEEIIFN